MIHETKTGPVRIFRLARSIWGRGLYFTAAYEVDGLLVDSGCAYTVREFVTALEQSPPGRVVNTHSHEDHVAANAALARRFGARLFAHADALPVLAHPERVTLRPYQKVMWGRPEPSEAEPLGDTVETDHYRFEVIHTPGHSPDHVCLFEPSQGWLFSGDTYIGGKDRALRQDYNIWQIIRSLKTLVSREPRLIFPGSGTVRNDAVNELHRKIRYLEETGERVQELHEQGKSRREIRYLLMGREMPIAYMTLGHFSGRNLIRSFLEDHE